MHPQRIILGRDGRIAWRGILGILHDPAVLLGGHWRPVSLHEMTREQ